MGGPAQVEFHTGVPDPLAFACRLIRKACRSGARLTVTAPAERLTALDRALWTFDAHAFIPHARAAAAPPPMLARSPVWLVDGGSVPDDAPPLLLNVGDGALPPPGRYERIIEVVGDDPEEVKAARERWRAYEQWGVVPVHHRAGGTQA